MNRKFLEELGLEKETIDKVMAEHGKTIQSVKPDDYEELKVAKATLEQQIVDLQGTLDAKDNELNSVGELKKEVETYKLKHLKTSIAVKAGIPLELAGRLSGSTEEEIKADAESLAGLVNTKQPLPLKHTEPPKADAEESAYANMLEKL